MRHAFLALVFVTVGTWAFYLFHNASVVISLARLGDVSSENIPFLLVPLTGLVASISIGFLSIPRLRRQLAFALETVLLGIGCFFLVVVMASRTG